MSDALAQGRATETAQEVIAGAQTIGELVQEMTPQEVLLWLAAILVIGGVVIVGAIVIGRMLLEWRRLGKYTGADAKEATRSTVADNAERLTAIEAAVRAIATPEPDPRVGKLLDRMGKTHHEDDTVLGRLAGRGGALECLDHIERRQKAMENAQGELHGSVRTLIGVIRSTLSSGD